MSASAVGALPRRRLAAVALLAAGLSVANFAAPAAASNPTIEAVPDAGWHFTNTSPPIRFKVKNTSPRGQGPRRINSIHIITNAPNSVPMRPLDIYRTTEDGRTSAQAPTCEQRGTNGLACGGLDAGPGDTLTVDFTTSPNPYPHSETITVIADSKVGAEEILGDPITLNGPGPPPTTAPAPSPYPPPPPIAPPPPNNAMATGPKKKVVLFGKGAALAGGTIAFYGACSAACTGPVPDPVTKGTGGVLLAVGAGLALVGVTVDFVAELVDPFDPDFREVPEVARPHAPRVSAGNGISKSVARAANRMSKNAARVDAYGDALVTAYNRAASATQQDDLAARTSQLRAGAGFARTLAGLLDDGPDLRRRLAHAIRASDLSLKLKPSRFAELRDRLRDGPTRALRSTLKAYGLSKAEIRKFTRKIANVRLGSPLPRVTTMLTDDQTARAEHRVADGFRQVARAFAAAA